MALSGGPVDWVKVNAGQAGFYRVAYSPELLAALGAAVPTMRPADRAGLVADAFALAAAGYGPTAGALRLLEAYSGEKDYAVWSHIASGLQSLLSVWHAAPPDVAAGLEAFARDLYAPLAKHLGWAPVPGESHLNAMLRTLANGRAAALGDPAVLAEARARVTAFCGGDANALAPDLRAGAFKAVVSRGGAAEFDALLAVYDGAGKSQELRIAVLTALGAAKEEGLIARALALNMSERVRKQDMMYIIASAAANPAGRRLCWRFFQDHFEEFRTMLDGTGMLLGRLVAISTALLTERADAAAVEAFFRSRNVPALARTVSQSAEKIRCNAGWLERDSADVAVWVRARQGKK